MSRRVVCGCLVSVVVLEFRDKASVPTDAIWAPADAIWAPRTAMIWAHLQMNMFVPPPAVGGRGLRPQSFFRSLCVCRYLYLCVRYLLSVSCVPLLLQLV